MSDLKEPRRYKMPSELTDDERAAATRFGASGQVERDEYRDWRRHVLADERDDLALRGRLLEEEAEVLRDRAAAREMDALGKLTPEDWLLARRRRARRGRQAGSRSPSTTVAPPGSRPTRPSWSARPRRSATTLP